MCLKCRWNVFREGLECSSGMCFGKVWNGVVECVSVIFGME